MARILIIDDDERVLAMLADAVRGAGHTVVTATNGRHGLDAFRAGPADLVITDIIMPDVEGIETIVELRALSANVPILAISGGSLQGVGSYLPTAAALGATVTLEKPFRVAVLLNAVERLLAERANEPSRPA